MQMATVTFEVMLYAYSPCYSVFSWWEQTGSFFHSDVDSLFRSILYFVTLFSFSAEEEESVSGNHSNVATEKVAVPWKLEDQDNSSRYSVSIMLWWMILVQLSYFNMMAAFSNVGRKLAVFERWHLCYHVLCWYFCCFCMYSSLCQA